jgi:RNA polymerase sigma-70 factor (sigma-E family)
MPAWRRAFDSWRPGLGHRQPLERVRHLFCVRAINGGVTMQRDRPRWVVGGLDRARDVDLADLYAAHYQDLVRLAGFLLGNAARAEDIAQDAFVRIAASSVTLRDPDRAHGYLRSVVVNSCRAAHRHGRVVDKHSRRLKVAELVGSAEEHAFTAFDRDELVVALRSLAPRKREVVVLRHYCDMSEAQVADLLGISVGTVKSSTARGLKDLAAAMGARS